VVTVTETTSDPEGAVLRVDRTRLRFLDAGILAEFLVEAGLVIDAQHGGWFGEAMDQAAPEIVTFARRP